MSEQVVVLLSGGQDSTTALFWAKRRWPDAQFHALSIVYGQRHAVEVWRAGDIAGLANAKHVAFQFDVLEQLADSALVGAGEIAASGGYADEQVEDGLPTSFVPGRNAFFLLIAGAYAVKVGAQHIVTGVCQTDYSGYPDCRMEFISRMAETLDAAMPSSCGPFTIWTPLMDLNKAETVRLARELPGCWEALALSVTCYEGRVQGPCGRCPACVLRAKGFADAGEQDPAEAAHV